MRFCSLPRSIAITTARCVALTGVMMREARSGRDCKLRLFVRQARTHTPQPRHMSLSTLALRRCDLCGWLAETSVIASTGQAFMHLTQPLHVARLTCGMKLVV